MTAECSRPTDAEQKPVLHWMHGDRSGGTHPPRSSDDQPANGPTLVMVDEVSALLRANHTHDPANESARHELREVIQNLTTEARRYPVTIRVTSTCAPTLMPITPP